MKTYKSKIGLELAIPLSGLLVGLGSLMVYKGVWPGAAIILVVSLLILHLFSTTRYKLDKNTLHIRADFFFTRRYPSCPSKILAKPETPLAPRLFL